MHIIHIFLVLLLCNLPATHAHVLSTTIHQSALGSIGASFNLVGNNGANCPTSIKHSISNNVLPHSGLLVQGKFCGSAGSASIFKTDATGDMARATSAIPASFVAGQNLVKNVFSNAQNAVIAIDSSDRTCGSFTFPKGTVSAFIMTAVPVNVAPGQTLPNGFWLVITRPGNLGLCVYNGPTHVPRNNVGKAHNPNAGSGPVVTPATGNEHIGNEPIQNGATYNGPISTPPPHNRGQEPEIRYYDDSCFPGDVYVHLENGSSKMMRDVEIGDRVKVAPGIYSPVFMFTHRVPDTAGPFVEISTNDGAIISLTSGHYLHVNGELVPASTVRLGDVLQNGNGVAVYVTNINMVVRKGLYNPQTVHGDIVVEGIRSSTYTTAVNPDVAHSLLAPFRAVFEWTGSSVGLFEGGAHAPSPVNLVAMEL